MRCATPILYDSEPGADPCVRVQSLLILHCFVHVQAVEMQFQRDPTSVPEVPHVWEDDEPVRAADTQDFLQVSLCCSTGGNAGANIVSRVLLLSKAAVFWCALDAY